MAVVLCRQSSRISTVSARDYDIIGSPQGGGPLAERLRKKRPWQGLGAEEVVTCGLSTRLSAGWRFQDRIRHGLPRQYPQPLPGVGACQSQAAPVDRCAMINRLAQALERSMAVLECIAAGEVTFTVLQARMDGLPAATLSRLLKALLASGQIAGGPRGYRLTPLAQQHAEAVLVAVRAAEIVAAPVQKLAQASGESAAFYAWDAGRVLLRATHVVADSAAYAPLGSRVPELTRHGFAMACVVGFDQALQRQAFVACPRRRETTWPKLRNFLAEANNQGAVVEPGWHRPGVLRVAAPVPGFGAIGVSSPRSEHTHTKRLVELAKIAAAEAQKLLT